MHVVGQNDQGIDTKRRPEARPADRLAQRASTCATSRSERRSRRFTVKRKVPPGTRLRRYSGMKRVCPASEKDGMRSAVPLRLLGGLADVERDLIRTRTAEGRGLRKSVASTWAGRSSSPINRSARRSSAASRAKPLQISAAATM